jgi:hypothetical protein
VNFDTAKLRTGEIVAAVGAILLFVFMFFFKWYGISLPGGAGAVAKSLGVDLGAVGVNGWHGHTVLRWLMLLTIIAALGLAFITATQRTVALPVTGAVLTTAIAGFTTVLLAYRVIINEPGPNDLIAVKPGAWLGLIAAAVVTYGGYLSMKEEGTSLADAREQARAAGSQARAAFDSTATRAGEAGTSAPPPSSGYVPPAPPAPPSGEYAAPSPSPSPSPSPAPPSSEYAPPAPAAPADDVADADSTSAPPPAAS